ncbi:hypothetical protein [Bradyrhizobium sp. 188]|uniref:hypothetical protein n=1 Tax=Bradyrhizobium sp. 188 TaxID=2782656 RepID=UPI001FF78BF1|nr:hypothetical protein [Bradyrhizobium sp. 188]MCK1501498.1 hypothetical protein [Bradyrhizobium sp. 188]
MANLTAAEKAAAKAAAEAAAKEAAGNAQIQAAPAAATPVPAKPVRALAPISVTRWSEAAFKQGRHAITPDADTPVEHLLNPAYFAHIAPKVNSGDVIEVRPADNLFYLELYVWAKGSNWLHVSELRRIERPSMAAVAAEDGKFSIEFVDGAKKYRVIRNSDRAELSNGFETPEIANAWLAGNRSKVAA